MANPNPNKPPTLAETYENLRQLAARGDFSKLVEPLDYKILEHIPDEGTMFANLYPIGASAPEVAKKLTPLDAKTVGIRFRVLIAYGLIDKVHGLRSSINQYQRTKMGKEVFEKWLQQQSKSQ